MEYKKEIKKECLAVKITAEENGQTVGRAWLYVLFNDLHQEPYGLLEDVFVEESQRGKGIGNELLKNVIAEAKDRGCYKLVGNSRHSRDGVHAWYTRLGFKDYGKEFRIDLK